MNPVAMFVKIILQIFSDDHHPAWRHWPYVDFNFIIYYNIICLYRFLMNDQQKKLRFLPIFDILYSTARGGIK